MSSQFDHPSRAVWESTSEPWRRLIETSLRDINDLVVRAVMRKTDEGGRSTSYVLRDLPR